MNARLCGMVSGWVWLGQQLHQLVYILPAAVPEVATGSWAANVPKEEEEEPAHRMAVSRGRAKNTSAVCIGPSTPDPQALVDRPSSSLSLTTWYFLNVW